jgi:hypothetical protein
VKLASLGHGVGSVLRTTIPPVPQCHVMSASEIPTGRVVDHLLLLSLLDPLVQNKS